MRTRRRDRARATADARAYATLLAPLLAADEAELRTGLDLYFAEVTGLRYVPPTDEGVTSLWQ